MSKEFEEIVLKKLDELSYELKDTKQELKELAKDTNQRLGKVELGLRDNKEMVIDLRQRFCVFDFEINRKIDTLFDSDTVNRENIVSLNVKNYNHDTSITNLENKDLSLVKA